ncbi:uncharacterized protein JN550_010633 [Neoarthrinium moseri]|uniref:uncharacterized protein n=1 Tax=Neoarthrinium moseri TaxID=1658444 RepID=UPI001FDBBB3C|nr:uncharacterized protein JN550_010633 [Neoarthrinium moseri]KAI1862002.1 hypothetical protein JN550_010633 [Neoarthrinium moseri]
MGYRDEGSKWIAVQSRDPAADGSFVYAVRTTKIYCRPVCTARLARRGNVEFFEQPRDAEKAGYRSCKRCRPQSGKMPEAAAATRIRSLIVQELKHQAVPGASQGNDEGISKTTGRLARKAQVSKWHFHRIFKDITGLTPSEYFRRQGRVSSGTPSIPSPQSTLSTTAESSHLSNGTSDFPTPGGETSDLYSSMVDWPSLYNEFSVETLLQPNDFCSYQTLMDGIFPISTLGDPQGAVVDQVLDTY